MLHGAVDLETYARLYMDDRLRDAADRQRANEVVTGTSWLGRSVARVQSWFAAVQHADVSHVPVSAQPVRLVPRLEKPLPASADPYAGMIVLVRGPKEPCTLDAA